MRISPVYCFVLSIAMCSSATSCAQTETPQEDENATTTLAFGSCADMTETTGRTWDAILAANPDALVLLGDTPYIDSTDPDRQRQRYEQFAATPGFTAAREATTIYGTWDDHDFGRNDTDGNLEGKENSRAAFIEHYEPLGNATFGNGEAGVYTSFVVDNIEVFLLDTRYFAATETAENDEDKLTLLGHDQWRWLVNGLEDSTADFKVLACGMIWNGSVRPGKTDHWAAYPHEYQDLMTFINEERIDGVVLVGGDIHRSRCVLHDTSEAAGYDIPEFITSPMHDRIIDAANQPHDGLRFDTGTPNSYLLLETGTSDSGEPELTARFLAVNEDAEAGDEGEELFVFRRTLSELTVER